MTLLSIGTQVIRIGSDGGRTGDIVEVNETTGRYRVRWTAEPGGRPIRGGKGLRTWVKYEYVGSL
jgi:hypothetical protein